LSDDNWSGTDDEDLRNVVASWHLTSSQFLDLSSALLCESNKLTSLLL
jgi:hypothetical protein